MRQSPPLPVQNRLEQLLTLRDLKKRRPEWQAYSKSEPDQNALEIHSSGPVQHEMGLAFVCQLSPMNLEQPPSPPGCLVSVTRLRLPSTIKGSPSLGLTGALTRSIQGRG